MSVSLLLLAGAIAPVFAQDPSALNGQSFPGLTNPSISANGLFLGGAQWNDGVLAPPPSAAGAPLPGQGETFGTGLSLQEMEVQLLSAVDPYFKANMVLAIPGGEGLEVEEGFVTLTSIPRLLVNIGKIKEPFGKENSVHTHALFTLDKSLIGQRVFGEEGLNDVSVNAQLMLPTPWFSELTVGADAGSNEVFLASGEPGGMGILGRWRNLVDLSDTTTAELGASAITGANDLDGRSVVGGLDLTFQGHGTGARQFKRMLWQSELVWMDKNGPDGADGELVNGLTSTLQGSFNKRVWLGGRFDLVGLTEAVDGGTTYGATAIGVFAPSEFSAVRLQGQRQFLPNGHTVDSITSQLIYTIGAHPAHAY